MEKTKSFIYISVIILILGFGGYGIYQKFFSTPVYDSPINEPVQRISTNPELDTDGDGLRDWEEVLWKTDPFIADTDGDGTNDGDEVALSRDPSVKGPADNIDTTPSENSTSKIAEGLLNNYLEAIDQGSPVDTADKIAAEILKNTYLESKANTYTLADVKTTGNSLADVKIYGNNLSDAFLAFNQTGNGELVIFALALQNNDPLKIRELEPIIKNYKEVLSGILSVTAPSSLQEEHLLLVNSLNKVIADIEGMRLLYTDTTVAVSSISTYQSNLLDFRNQLVAIVSSITQKGIEYSTDESGYRLLNIL